MVNSASSTNTNTADYYHADLARQQFPYVDIQIGHILVGPAVWQQNNPLQENDTFIRNSRFQLQRQNLKIRITEEQDRATIQDLIPLACQCDQVVFGDDDHVAMTTPACWILEAMQGDVQIQALTKLASSGTTTGGSDAAGITVSLILALNALESTLRQSIPGGRAPLLTNLLARYRQQAAGTSTSSPSTPTSIVLDLLLLPNTGLNLRNLLWHGFCGASTALRPWLALVLVLLQQLREELYKDNDDDAVNIAAAAATISPTVESPLFRNAHNVNSLTKQRLMDIVAQGRALRAELGKTESSESVDPIAQWIVPADHPHHRALWEYCVKKLQPDCPSPSPVIVSVLLTFLLEHGLRLLWCAPSCNDRPEDRIARNNHFYVTLDGHGQRHKHDVILHPFLGGDNGNGPSKKNRLVLQLGGSSVALLTDLFISGSGGPNLRAALSHGVYDDQMDLELQGLVLEPKISSTQNKNTAWDVVDVLLAAMEQIAISISNSHEQPMGNVSPAVQQYRPIFSFTASTLDVLNEAQSALERLTTLIRNNPTHTTGVLVPGLPASVADLSMPADLTQTQLNGVLSMLQWKGGGDSGWTADDVFAEHETNRILEPLGATRSLLSDISIATCTLQNSLEEALQNLDGTVESSSGAGRQRKQMKRVAACSQVILQFYSFAAHVGVLSLQQVLFAGNNKLSSSGATADISVVADTTEMLKAVERTRMVVSTVSTFVLKNTDRAWKAMDQYAKGKIVKKIVQEFQNDFLYDTEK